MPPRERLEARIYTWEAPGFTAELRLQLRVFFDRERSRAERPAHTVDVPGLHHSALAHLSPT